MSGSRQRRRLGLPRRQRAAHFCSATPPSPGVLVQLCCPPLSVIHIDVVWCQGRTERVQAAVGPSTPAAQRGRQPRNAGCRAGWQAVSCVRLPNTAWHTTCLHALLEGNAGFNNLEQSAAGTGQGWGGGALHANEAGTDGTADRETTSERSVG